MPIVGNKNNVHVEYSIPENIKRLITDEFLKEFRNQLMRIHEYWSIDTFAEEGIPSNTSTSGWYVAFGKACLLTNNDKLFAYWRALPWYDSDIFDGELVEMLIERHFILGNLGKVIEEQLGVKESDLRVCCDCGKMYLKDMVTKLTDEESSEEISGYRCLCCNDIKNTKDRNRNATDYYRMVLEELNEYKKNNPIVDK